MVNSNHRTPPQCQLTLCCGARQACLWHLCLCWLPGWLPPHPPGVSINRACDWEQPPFLFSEPGAFPGLDGAVWCPEAALCRKALRHGAGLGVVALFLLVAFKAPCPCSLVSPPGSSRMPKEAQPASQLAPHHTQGWLILLLTLGARPSKPVGKQPALLHSPGLLGC